jgi:hypothetical protein
VSHILVHTEIFRQFSNKSIKNDINYTINYFSHLYLAVLKKSLSANIYLQSLKYSKCLCYRHKISIIKTEGSRNPSWQKVKNQLIKFDGKICHISSAFLSYPTQVTQPIKISFHECLKVYVLEVKNKRELFSLFFDSKIVIRKLSVTTKSSCVYNELSKIYFVKYAKKNCCGVGGNIKLNFFLILLKIERQAKILSNHKFL